MKVLYGTANPAKVQHMRDMLDGLGIEIISLNDLDLQVSSIDESGSDPLENAKIKALAYYQVVKMPVFSCDSGLYIEGLPDDEQPGVHVRRVNGKYLNDEEMIDYYSNLVHKLGGEAKAKYKNAICLVVDEENIYGYDGDDIATKNFILTSKVHPQRRKGFPLDSLSVDLATGKHYNDLKSYEAHEDPKADGFKNFFTKNLLQYESVK